MKALWKEYCLKSTLHGLRYVVESENSIYEKIIWSGLLAMATIFVFYHLLVSWKLYSAAPTRITIDDPRYPMSKIDFPAITICPVNKVKYSEALNLYKQNIYNKTFVNVSENCYMDSMLLLSLMRYPFYNQASAYYKSINQRSFVINNEQIKDIMLQVMPTIDEMFAKCYWRGTQYNCSEMLQLQPTEEGFCYSFNSKTAIRKSHEIFIRTPPFINSDGKLVAIRNNVAGKITGFEFMLNSLDNEYFPNDKRAKGFNIMVHNPDDFPDVTLNHMIYKQYNKVFRIGIKALIVDADNSLKSLTDKQRGCRYYEDYHSQNLTSAFTTDSESNCYLRCRLKSIYDRCKCSPYFLKIFDNAKYCGIQHVKCLSLINVLQRNYLDPEKEEESLKWSLPMYMNCNCLQSCKFVAYRTEFRTTFSDLWLTENFSLYVDIMYKELFAIKYKRFLVYSGQDLLVSFGGVASLFLGCSIVSIIEYLYYCVKSLLYVIHRIFLWIKLKRRIDDRKIYSRKTKPIQILPYLP